MKNIAALGLAAAIAGSVGVGFTGYAAAATATAHVAWCEQNYRSYNAATDSFTGYDGLNHRCVSPGNAAILTFGLTNPLVVTRPAPQAPSSAGGHGYNVFPSESDPNYNTDASHF